MIDRDKFFAGVKIALFSKGYSTGEVDGINDILDAWDKYGDKDERKLGYLFATDYHETAFHMEGIDEIGKGAGHAYGQPAGPFHLIYFGRGAPQMTWYANYVRADDKAHNIGLFKPEESLVKTPELANRRDVSAWLLIAGAMDGWWTGHKLGDYFNATKSDPVGARRVINGTDKADLIAGYYRTFLNTLVNASVLDAPPVGATPQPQVPVPAPVDASKPQTAPKPLPAAPMGLLAFIIKLISMFFTRKAKP